MNRTKPMCIDSSSSLILFPNRFLKQCLVDLRACMIFICRVLQASGVCVNRDSLYRFKESGGLESRVDSLVHSP